MMTLTKTYHVDIGLPEGVQQPSEAHPLVYSQHAKHEAGREAARGHVIELPHQLPAYRLVEVQILGHVAVKWVVRVRVNDTQDLVLVLQNNEAHYLVRTVWVNEASDNHKTLDRSKYALPMDERGA